MHRVAVIVPTLRRPEGLASALASLMAQGMPGFDAAVLGTHLHDRLDQFNTIDRGRLEALKERLRAIGKARVAIDIPYGLPVEEILKRATIAKTSLVVMGSHGRGYISELFLGSVSHNVARHSEAPVLLISGQHGDVQIPEERE